MGGVGGGSHGCVLTSLSQPSRPRDPPPLGTSTPRQERRRAPPGTNRSRWLSTTRTSGTGRSFSPRCWLPSSLGLWPPPVTWHLSCRLIVRLRVRSPWPLGPISMWCRMLHLGMINTTLPRAHAWRENFFSRSVLFKGPNLRHQPVLVYSWSYAPSSVAPMQYQRRVRARQPPSSPHLCEIPFPSPLCSHPRRGLREPFNSVQHRPGTWNDSDASSRGCDARMLW